MHIGMLKPACAIDGLFPLRWSCMLPCFCFGFFQCVGAVCFHEGLFEGCGHKGCWQMDARHQRKGGETCGCKGLASGVVWILRRFSPSHRRWVCRGGVFEDGCSRHLCCHSRAPHLRRGISNVSGWGFSTPRPGDAKRDWT